MNRYLQLIQDKIESRPKREQKVIFVIALIITFLIWNYVFSTMMSKKNTELGQQVRQARDKLSVVRERIKTLTTSAVNPVDPALVLQYNNAKHEFEIVDRKLQKVLSKTVAPDKLPLALKSLVILGNKLSINDLEINQATAPAVVKPAVVVNITHQFVTLSFHSNYLSTLQYLQSLEKSGWIISFDELDYQVTHYPIAAVTLKLHFLGVNTWIN